MPANQGDRSTLAALFAAHGLPSYINSTRSLVILLSEDGKLLSWNFAFDTFKKDLQPASLLRDFLSVPNRSVFDLLLSNVTHDHVATQGELDLGQENRFSGYTCFFGDG